MCVHVMLFALIVIDYLYSFKNFDFNKTAASLQFFSQPLYG